MSLTEPDDFTATPDTHKPWVEALGLTAIDRNRLDSGEWLSDNHIRAANALLRKTYPAQNGLQDTLALQEKLMWKSEPTDFVQVISISRNHWVCASNVLSSPGVVDVYDSLPSCMGKASFTMLKTQLAAVVKTEDEEFVIRLVDVQQQAGAYDCGLFAIVFEQELCVKVGGTKRNAIDAISMLVIYIYIYIF